MDTAQIAQMVNWLDEEHRRDRAEIARLQQRLEAQSSDIVEQARRIQELEARLAGTQAHLTKFGQIEHAIQNTKLEITALVERTEESRSQGQRELEQARLSDRETLSREISEVRKELPRISRLEEVTEMRSVEDNRLSELIMGIRNQIGSLAKEVEERTRQIPFLAEQRSSDTKRIAQLQQETVELFKRVEAVSGRVPVLEESIRRHGAEIEKVPGDVDALKEQQAAFIENVKATLVDREQVINRWKESLEEQKSLVTQVYDRMQNVAQQMDVARRSVTEMQEFKELIMREQSQVQELQRLAEERIRRDMDEFREDFEKRRRKADLRTEHLWSEQDKFNREIVERFPPLTHDLRIHESLIQQLWKLQETYGNYFLMTAQNWLEGMQASVKNRDEELRNLEEEWQRQRRNAELYTSQVSQRRTTGIITGDAPDQQNGNSRN